MGIDKECKKICNAINRISGIKTVESCCGHNKDPFRIFFMIDEKDINAGYHNLPILLYYLDPCHVGFRWNCLVHTDCAMSSPTFVIESETVGKESYKEANIIALAINNYLKHNQRQKQERLI